VAIPGQVADQWVPNLSPPSRIRASPWIDRNAAGLWVRTCSLGSPSSQFHSAPSVLGYGALEPWICLRRRAPPPRGAVLHRRGAVGSGGKSLDVGLETCGLDRICAYRFTRVDLEHWQLIGRSWRLRVMACCAPSDLDLRSHAAYRFARVMI
jgi:hypothetical protein